MEHTLLIQKKLNGTFWHFHDGDAATRFNISDFDVDLDGMKFNIVEKDGATRFTYLVLNITVQDLSGAGTLEVFTNPESLRARLQQISYTPYIRDVLDDAPLDGQTYGRKNGAWVLVEGGGTIAIYKKSLPYVTHAFEIPDYEEGVLIIHVSFGNGQILSTLNPDFWEQVNENIEINEAVEFFGGETIALGGIIKS